MTNFTDMLSKAKDMQDKMKEAQEQIKKIEVVGEAGGNLVKVVLTGDYELKSISISEEAKKEDQASVDVFKKNGVEIKEMSADEFNAWQTINL